jgi:hypothetical protein
MILPLRQRHRRMMIALAMIIPATFVMGIALRRNMTARATPRLLADLRDSETEVWNRSDVFSKIPVRVRLLRGPMSSFYAVDLSAGRAFAKPDLLVYWVAAEARVTNVLPDSARLLGTFIPSRPLRLPQETNQTSGLLVMYSLADQEVVDVSQPIRFGESAK